MVLTDCFAEDIDFDGRVDLHEHLRRAEQQHEQVRQAEVQQEEVGRVAQLAVPPDHQRHQDVADDADGQDQRARERHQNSHIGGELRLFALLVSLTRGGVILDGQVRHQSHTLGHAD